MSGVLSRARALILALAALGLTAGEVHAAGVSPPPDDTGRGLLFHASFDRGVRAELASGGDLPLLAQYRNPARQMDQARQVPGVFGPGMTNAPGSYPALVNTLAERGTICFFIQHQGLGSGFDPLRFQTLDQYYWRSYLRISYERDRLSAWLPDENFHVTSIVAPARMRLHDGRWYHLALSWDQAYGAVLYLDGKPVASNWGETSWHSRGVDPAELLLAWTQSAAYDELYVFDRPLTDVQIRTLVERNRPPSSEELAPVEFDERRRRNRLRELSWEHVPDGLLSFPVGAAATGRMAATVIRQVIPRQARALLGDGSAVIDGKLGSGWPTAPNRYSFNNGNGLSIYADEPYDYVMLEGRARGRIYAGRHLVVPTETVPLWEGSSTDFMTRWALPEPRKGWLSYFWTEPDDLGGVRIIELGLFRRGSPEEAQVSPRTLFLEDARLLDDADSLASQLRGRFAAGDRAVLGLSDRAPGSSGGQVIPGLRFQHLIVPGQKTPWGLRGIRLRWWLRGAITDTALRIELRDPALPGRRLVALDVSLDAGEEEDRGKPQLLELTLDLADRRIPEKRPLWLTFVFSRDVELLWDGAGQNSRIELLTADVATVSHEFLENELSFVKGRFRLLSEPRPWANFTPESEVAEFNKRVEELFVPLETLWQSYGEDPRVRALWYWTHKSLQNSERVDPLPVRGHADAPRWALLQRELLGWCRKVLYWWFDKRQAPNGELGDDWGDDTDLIQNVPALVLLGDPDGRLRRGARAVAEGVAASGRMLDGINARTMGPLHAYEEGLNAQLAMALIDWGNPLYLERLMQAARTVEEHLMARDAAGRLRFRSSRFGARTVLDRGAWAFDSPNNALMLHPSLTLAYYAHHERATALVAGWVDGWLHSYLDAAVSHDHPPGKPYPSRMRTDGTVLEWDHMARGFGYVSTYVGAYALTGEARYRDSARYWTGEYSPRAFMRGNSSAGPALELLDRKRFRKELIRWAEQTDLSRPGPDHLGRLARQRYMKWEMDGDEDAAYAALEAAIRKMRLMFDAFTWAEPIADRIWLPQSPLLMMTQGEISYERNQLWPQHYVSYEGLTDFAAWVREKSDTRIHLWIYSFANASEEGRVRVWRTPHGRYRIRSGEDRDADGHPDSPHETHRVLHRYAAVPLRVKPGQLTALEIELVERSDEDFYQRPDLAVSSDTSERVGDVLLVRVHNLGGGGVREAVVRLVNEAGLVLAEQNVEHLEAPADLEPRVRTLRFPAVPPAQLFVEVDPGNLVPELNEDNNRAVIQAAGPR